MEQRMRIAAVALALAATTVVAGEPPEPGFRPGHEHELVFGTAGDLLPWCRQEAEAHYVGLGFPTYQWTARYKQDGNMLVVEGKLRVHQDDVPVRCRVPQNARERYAVIEIDDPVLQASGP